MDFAIFSWVLILFNLCLQIPDVRSDDDVIDAVVVDEEAVGSEGHGNGAKILHGKGALEHYLSQHKLKDFEVCMTSTRPLLYA